MKRKHKTSNGSQLTLFDACGMAIGGMVGGGIFAVLGEAAHHSGNASFISFGLAGILALITGISYLRLTIDFDEPGGSFSYIEKIYGRRAAGTVAWFLLLGYVFTISLYAFTFGAYAGRLLGLGSHWNGVIGLGIITVLTGLNLVGVRESGVTEDILVYGKVLILLVVAGTGLFTVKHAEATPIFEHSGGSVIAAAALIFVAYEGFQLLTYDYADIRDHKRNLPRAVWISIPIVMAIYMLIALVATGTLPDSTIAQHKETVLAYVSRPVLGKAGFLAVLIAAVFSTASAINATIFATGRLAKRIAKDHQLPPELVSWQSGGVPIMFCIVTAVMAATVQFFGNLNQITTFSSLVFLTVFAVVNLVAFIHKSFDGWGQIVPVIGCAGCLGAAVLLINDLLHNDPITLWIIAAISAVLILLRVIYVYAHPHFSIHYSSQ